MQCQSSLAITGISFAVLLLETWLGRTTKVKAGSILEGVLHLTVFIFKVSLNRYFIFNNNKGDKNG